MDIGKILVPMLTTAGGVLAITAWSQMPDGELRGLTALLAGLMLARGISQLAYRWNTRNDTDNADR
jgi:hypothetical protein